MSVERMSKSAAIGWLITIALAIICLLIPEQGFYTNAVKIFLAITVFFLSAAAFEILPTLLIGLCLPSFYLFFNIAPAATVMSPWVGSTMLMIIGIYVLAMALEDCGFLKRVTMILMYRIKSNYMALIISIMFIGILLNLVTSGRAYMILPPLCAGLCISLNCMGKRMGAGIAMACMVGSCTSHSFTYQSTMWGIIYKMMEGYISPTAITPLNMIVYTWPLLIVSLLIVFVIGKIYKPDQKIGNIDYFKNELDSLGKVTREEKINAGVLLVLLIYIFTVNWHKLDLNLGFAIIPFMIFLPFLNGADPVKVAHKVNWSAIFFCAGCVSIGSVAGGLGLGEVISSLVLEISAISGNSVISVFALVFAVVFILNFLMTPMAILSLIAQPMCLVASSLGYSAVPFALAINACTEAIILPYEYIPYLLVYSFGMMSMKDFIKTNIIRSVIFFLGFLFVLVPHWMLIGLL